MQASPFFYHELNINNTKTIQNQKPFKNFNFNKLCIHTITLYKGMCFSRSQTPLYILTKRKLIKKLLKAYPPHGSSHNQKKTKSHGSPCDSISNHKETKSHDSSCDFTINHKKTISYGAHDISQCTMTKLWNFIIQLTSLNNYLSNYAISSSYTPSYMCTFWTPKKFIPI